MMSTQLVVRALTGAKTQYLFGALNNCKDLYLRGYYLDPILAECAIGDVLQIRTECSDGNYVPQYTVVANTGSTAPQISAGISLPVSNVGATLVPLDPPLLIARLPARWCDLQLSFLNGSSGAALTISANGSSRALATLVLEVTHQGPSDHTRQYTASYRLSELGSQALNARAPFVEY